MIAVPKPALLIAMALIMACAIPNLAHVCACKSTLAGLAIFWLAPMNAMGMERASMTQLVNPNVSVIKVSVAVTVALQIALLALMVQHAAARDFVLRAVMSVLARTVSMGRPVSMLLALQDHLMLPALSPVSAVAMVCAHPVRATALRGGAAMTVPLLSALVLAAVMVFARKVASVNANLGGMEMTAAKLVV